MVAAMLWSGHATAQQTTMSERFTDEMREVSGEYAKMLGGVAAVFANTQKVVPDTRALRVKTVAQPIEVLKGVLRWRQRDAAGYDSSWCHAARCVWYVLWRVGTASQPVWPYVIPLLLQLGAHLSACTRFSTEHTARVHLGAQRSSHNE